MSPQSDRFSSLPVLSIHSDPGEPPSQSRGLHDALTRAGVQNQLLLVPDGGHGYVGGDMSAKIHEGVRAFLQGYAS